MKARNAIFFLGVFVFVLAAAEFSVEKARRVDDFLKRIAEKNRSSVFLKKITFAEDELNSYINIFYLKRYSPEVKYLKLELRKKNLVSGVMKVKLTGEKYEKVPSFLKDFEIEFEGKLECENYRVRFQFDKMEINGTLFSPEILDEAFYAAQSGFKIKKSIFDWFSLLPGLKNVLIEHKKITIFY